MPLWSYTEKPKYVTNPDNITATQKGWVLSENNNTELLVSIPNLLTKQNNFYLENTPPTPVISSISLDNLYYDMETDTEIRFEVQFNYPVNSSLLTSDTYLAFDIGDTSCQAPFDSQLNSQTLQFIYTFPLTIEERLLLVPNESTNSITVNEIILNGNCCGGGGDTLYLDNENYITEGKYIVVNLIVPQSISSITNIEIVYIDTSGCCGGCCGGNCCG